MKSQRIHQIAIVVLLISASAVAQAQGPQRHPRAAQALEKAVPEQNFGKLHLEKHEVVTVRDNRQVPGLNGLMFVYYKSDGGRQIMLSVQWFEETKDLLAFYESQLKEQIKQLPELKKREFDMNVIWSEGDKAYFWTDRKHFAVGMGGDSIPPEMAKAYLRRIPGRDAGIEKKSQQKGAGEGEEGRKAES